MMKIDEAERIAKRAMIAFAAPQKTLLEANKDRFVLQSWKGDDAWYVTVAVFPKAAMTTKAVFDDRPENRALEWLLVRVDNSGGTQVEVRHPLKELLSS